MKKIAKWKIEYWLNKGFSEEDAKIELEKYLKTKKNNLPRPKSFNIEDWLFLGYTFEDATKIINEKKEKNKLRPNSYSLQYWLDKGFSEEDAKINLKERIDKSNIILKDKETIEKWKSNVGKSSILSHKKKKLNDPFNFYASSRYRKEHWIKKGFSEEESIKKSWDAVNIQREKLQKILKIDPTFLKDKTQTSLQYWLNKGFSEDDAKLKLKERQSTFTLEKCILKYGQEIGTEKFLQRQINWSTKVEKLYKEGKFTKFSKNNYSNIEKELWTSIVNKLNLKDDEYNSCINNSKIFYRYFEENKRTYSYDFRYKNKIIEFNGVLWHCKPDKWKENDICSIRNISAKQVWELEKIKLDLIKSKGYDVLVIWEDEYKKDKETIIQKCINYLNEK